MRLAATSEERAEDADAGAHRLDDVVRGADGAVVLDREREAGAVALDVDAKLREQLGHGADVGEVGDVAEDEAFAAGKEERRGHHGEGGVLRSVDADRAAERTPAVDDELVQVPPRPELYFINYKL